MLFYKITARHITLSEQAVQILIHLVFKIFRASNTIVLCRKAVLPQLQIRRDKLTTNLMKGNLLLLSALGLLAVFCLLAAWLLSLAAAVAAAVTPTLFLIQNLMIVWPNMPEPKLLILRKHLLMLRLSILRTITKLLPIRLMVLK